MGAENGSEGLLSLIIPGDSNTLSHNRRLNHWTKYAHMKRWRTNSEIIARAAWGGRPPLEQKVLVRFTVRRPRLLDPDNANSAAMKAILDGLVDAGVLKGDTIKHVEMAGVSQEKSVQPEVQVDLEEIQE